MVNDKGETKKWGNSEKFRSGEVNVGGVGRGQGCWEVVEERCVGKAAEQDRPQG